MPVVEAKLESLGLRLPPASNPGGLVCIDDALRSAVGMAELPLGISVEMVIEAAPR